MRLCGETRRQLESTLDKHNRPEEATRPRDRLLQRARRAGVAEVRPKVVEKVRRALFWSLLNQPGKRSGGVLSLAGVFIEKSTFGDSTKRRPVAALDRNVNRVRQSLTNL